MDNRLKNKVPEHIGFLAGSLGVLLVLCVSTWGDIVYLKAGGAVRGEIVASDEKTVTVKVTYGKVVIDREQIERIEKEDDLKLLLAEAKRLQMSGAEAEAERKYDETLKRFPDSETARTELAKILKRKARLLLAGQKVSEAEPVLRRLLALSPDDSFAKDELKKIEEVKGSSGDLTKEAVLLARTGRGREALEKFDKLVEVLPEVAQRQGKWIAQAHVSEADELLSIGRFREAGKHYEEAVQADPTLAKSLKERRLVSILEPIARERKENEDKLPRERWTELAGELEAAEKIDPDNVLPSYYLGEIYIKLGKRGEARTCFARASGGAHGEDESLKSLYDLAGDKVRQTVLRVTWEDNRWAEASKNVQVLTTEHFNIYHHNKELAEIVAETAEYFYGRIYRELGQTPPKNWPSKCGIWIYRTKEEYLKASGQDNWSEANAKTVSAEGVLKEHSIMTYQTVRNLESSHLPHELTHIIQSAVFDYSTHIPVWLKEGLAAGGEPWFKQRVMGEVLTKERRSEQAFTLQQLTSQKGYPAAERVRVFYAQSIALVRALLKQKDMDTFNRFTKQLTTENFEATLKDVYGMTPEEIEKSWNQEMDAMEAMTR